MQGVVIAHKASMAVVMLRMATVWVFLALAVITRFPGVFVVLPVKGHASWPMSRRIAE
jgi:uncharacterized membrane protein